MNDSTTLSDREVFDLYPDVMINHDNIDHYRALARGKLVIKQCQDCGYWVYPHRPICPECWSWNLTFTEVSGKGKVFMHTLLHQLRDPNSRIEEPIPLAAVELEEQAGLRYLAKIVNCMPHKITPDMPVTLTWLMEDGLPSPAFEPVYR